MTPDPGSISASKTALNSAPISAPIRGSVSASKSAAFSASFSGSVSVPEPAQFSGHEKAALGAASLGTELAPCRPISALSAASTSSTMTDG